jgi:hypothetical protein
MLGSARRGRVHLIRRGAHISNPGCASFKKAASKRAPAPGRAAFAPDAPRSVAALQ